jgi:hypothetical protein
VLAACEPRGHRFELWPYTLHDVWERPPANNLPKPRTAREPTALGTSLQFLVRDFETGHAEVIATISGKKQLQILNNRS